jgi:hypothetical protein
MDSNLVLRQDTINAVPGEVRPIAIASFCPGNITHAKVVLRSGRINVLVVVRLRFEFVDRN